MTQLRIDDMLGDPRPPRASNSGPSTRSRQPRNQSTQAQGSDGTRLAKDSPRRASNRALAEENGRLTKRGYDINGVHVDLPGMVAKSKRSTRSYTEADTERILAQQKAMSPGTVQTVYEVSAESSMAAAQRLAGVPSSSASTGSSANQSGSADRICVLNFASARHVGGGYLTGAKAQEEDVCRVSGLYSSLLCAPDFYAAHKPRSSDLRYSHRMVYSGNVPVFRDAARATSGASAATGSGASAESSSDGPQTGEASSSSATSTPNVADSSRSTRSNATPTAAGNHLLPKPYVVDILTSPAPNATALRQNSKTSSTFNLEPVLRERAGRILALALEHGADTIVLGAWGCGVFGNDLGLVLGVFQAWLEGELRGRFGKVIWAMNDSRGADRAAAVFTTARRV